MNPRSSEHKSTASASRLRPAAIAFAGLGIFLCLIVADGVRNWAPDDAPASRSLSSAVDDVDLSASFPRSGTQARAREAEQECAPLSSGPATGARPIGDQSRWLTSIDYPAASLAAGREGISSLAMMIDRRGMITGCKITASSGDPLLDAAACTTLRLRGRFEPARDMAGCPVPTEWRQRVRWQIPNE